MATPKYKHLKFEDRYVIQEFISMGYSFTAIGHRIGKDRRAVSKEIYNHRFLKPGLNKIKQQCPKTSKPPYVCNGCKSKGLPAPEISSSMMLQLLTTSMSGHLKENDLTFAFPKLRLLLSMM